MSIPRKGPLLHSAAEFYSYILVNRRRITPTSTARNAAANSAIIKVVINGKYCAGEVISVFQHAQSGLDSDDPSRTTVTMFVEVRWMKRLYECAVEGDPWLE